MPLLASIELCYFRNFHQGFATVEYTICALLDQALHALPEAQIHELDLEAFEREVSACLSRAGVRL